MHYYFEIASALLDSAMIDLSVIFQQLFASFGEPFHQLYEVELVADDFAVVEYRL